MLGEDLVGFTCSRIRQRHSGREVRATPRQIGNAPVPDLASDFPTLDGRTPQTISANRQQQQQQAVPFPELPPPPAASLRSSNNSFLSTRQANDRAKKTSAWGTRDTRDQFPSLGAVGGDEVTDHHVLKGAAAGSSWAKAAIAEEYMKRKREEQEGKRKRGTNSRMVTLTGRMRYNLN